MINVNPLQRKIFTGFTFILLFIYISFEAQTKGDFSIFLAASKDLFNNINVYEKLYFDGYHYFYSVFFAILIYPLTFISNYCVNFLWISFNIVLFYRLYKIITSLLPLESLHSKQRTFFWICSTIMSLRLILENLHVAQMTIFLLYVSLEGMYLIERQKIVYGAFLIALGVNIKLLPIVLLPYLIYRKAFKAAALVIFFYVILLFIPILVIGLKQNEILLQTWLNLINPLNSNHILDVDERSFHGLSTLLSTLLVEKVSDQYALSIKRNIANINLQTLSFVILGVRLILVMFTFYFLRTLPFRSQKNQVYRYWELSYILMIIPLIFPHQQHYAFFFIVPAFFYTLFYIIHNYKTLPKMNRIAYISLLACIYLLTNLKLLLGEFNPYYEHFKILTYGALLLIILLALSRPITYPNTIIKDTSA